MIMSDFMQLSYSSVLKNKKSNSSDKHHYREIRNVSSLQYLPDNTYGPSKFQNTLKNGTVSTLQRSVVDPQIHHMKMGNLRSPPDLQLTAICTLPKIKSVHLYLSVLRISLNIWLYGHGPVLTRTHKSVKAKQQ